MSPILGILASSRGGAANSYESIATVTLGSDTASVSFSSIPQTYTHLQIRCFYKTSSTGANMKIAYNSGAITLANSHYLGGDGSSAVSGRDTGGPIISLQAGNASNTFYAQIIDLLDYTSTNKNQTLRTLGGGDFNGSGIVYLISGLSTSTTAISQITLSLNTAHNYSTYSSFALYGIKG
jgi:hypothetical protein